MFLAPGYRICRQGILHGSNTAPSPAYWAKLRLVRWRVSTAREN